MEMSKPALFKKSENTQAYLKMGIMGFAGDGKTYTASEVAIGMVKHMKKNNVPNANNPVMFLDTETGSDWVSPRFDEEGIGLFVAKTRAFTDLLMAVYESEKSGSFLIIDSISHFWTVLCDEYATRKSRRYGLEFQDWAWLKQQWRKFTDAFVNSNCHIVMCGRAGYEYNFFENESGKRELEKTGIKMKAENETGFEPSLLIAMERVMDVDSKQVWRKATILKDRSTRIDGQSFTNPKFEDFLPHIQYLNLGGAQLGVDTSRNNSELFTDTGEAKSFVEARQKAIALDEIKEILQKHYPGRTAADTTLKADLLEYAFNTRSWSRVEIFNYQDISKGRNALWEKLEGKPYVFVDPNKAPAHTKESESVEATAEQEPSNG